jgi:hypothetical protein
MSLRIETPAGGHKFKALQMSLAVHVAVLLILIGAASSLKPADRLLVVDFRMEDSPNSGDRTFAASEVKPHEDIGQKAGTTKETWRKQKDQVDQPSAKTKCRFIQLRRFWKHRYQKNHR